MPVSKYIVATIGATTLFATTSIANAQDFNVTWKGAPEISSADGNFSIKLRGRLFTDWGTVSDNAGKAVDATEFRAARLGVEGVVMKDVEYKFEVDFAGNEVNITDATMELALEPVSIVAGQFKTPTSLEEQTSSRFTTFLERGSFTDAFSFSRQIGIAANYDQNNVTFKAGVFQGNANGGGGTIQGRTYAARATFAPQIGNGNNDGFIHIGASAFHRENDDGDLTIRYRQRPHHHLAGRYVDTANFPSDSDTFFGVELAGVMGPLSAQAEWGWMSANGINGAMDAKFNGGYIDISYILTGESRGYKGGAFDRIKVNNPVFGGGSGAFQIAARYDVIDLTDTSVGVIGGKQTSYIVGLNWLLNNYSRVMANYSRSDVEGGSNDGENIDTFGLRFQVDW
jgi:phosphate-selective porin OprO/OprP